MLKPVFTIILLIFPILSILSSVHSFLPFSMQSITCGNKIKCSHMKNSQPNTPQNLFSCLHSQDSGMMLGLLDRLDGWIWATLKTPIFHLRNTRTSWCQCESDACWLLFFWLVAGCYFPMKDEDWKKNGIEEECTLQHLFQWFWLQIKCFG